MNEKPQLSKEVRQFQNEQIEVFFRKAAPINVPEARYPGFKPSTTVLAKGYVHEKGALPLPIDILFERDVAVTLRDGTVIYTDVFRPVGGSHLPAIIAWSPYGKERGMTVLDDFPGRAGVPKSAVSELQKWEGPDPAYWCSRGYAIVNPDSRGAYSSNGDIQSFGGQDGRDGYDVVEWVAARDWSNGKVGFSGNSWLAISQWYIAAEQPPHLAAIAPWEGLCDQYREDVARGGIPNVGFCAFVIQRMRGKNRVEDVPAMVTEVPAHEWLLGGQDARSWRKSKSPPTWLPVGRVAFIPTGPLTASGGFRLKISGFASTIRKSGLTTTRPKTWKI